jgi:transcriptional regulator with XRE-family HTH domain
MCQHDAVSATDKARAKRLLPPPRERARIREAAGLSLDDLARDLGVHRTTILRWERDLRAPTGENVVRYATVLGQLQRLVTEEQAPRRGRGPARRSRPL